MEMTHFLHLTPHSSNMSTKGDRLAGSWPAGCSQGPGALGRDACLAPVSPGFREQGAWAVKAAQAGAWQPGLWSCDSLESVAASLPSREGFVLSPENGGWVKPLSKCIALPHGAGFSRVCAPNRGWRTVRACVEGGGPHLGCHPRGSGRKLPPLLGQAWWVWGLGVRQEQTQNRPPEAPPGGPLLP